jgi:hypothetical protein
MVDALAAAALQTDWQNCRSCGQHGPLLRTAPLTAPTAQVLLLLLLSPIPIKPDTLTSQVEYLTHTLVAAALQTI